MNCNDMTFGVEFEVTLPVGIISSVGSYHAGRQIPDLPAGWNAQSDSSIRVGTPGHTGVEVVSPILKGADGLSQIVFVLNWLNEKGAKVNSSTGLHVHVGFRGTEKEMAAIVSCVAQHEKALFASTGTKSRERGHYCGSIQNDFNYRERFADGERDTRITQRYHVLNLQNVLGGGKPTIEFRVFAGSLNVVKVLNYVRVCLALVERSLVSGRRTKWVAKPASGKNSVCRKGEGQTAMARLFYAIGWTKGRVDTVFGNVACDAATIEQGKKEFMRLAKKYDAAQ